MADRAVHEQCKLDISGVYRACFDWFTGLSACFYSLGSDVRLLGLARCCVVRIEVRNDAWDRLKSLARSMFNASYAMLGTSQSDATVALLNSAARANGSVNRWPFEWGWVARVCLFFFELLKKHRTDRSVGFNTGLARCERTSEAVSFEKKNQVYQIEFSEFRSVVKLKFDWKTEKTQQMMKKVLLWPREERVSRYCSQTVWLNDLRSSGSKTAGCSRSVLLFEFTSSMLFRF